MSHFDDMTSYLGIPRVTGLAMSPAGDRLVVGVARVDADGSSFEGSLWEVDPAGRDDARRITWSAKGESGPVFTHDGSLLFRSQRDTDDDDPPSLWVMPPGAGEARRLLQRGGGVGQVIAARAVDAVVVQSATLPDDDGSDRSDDDRRAARKDAKVAAILHQSSPVRYWDHDLGPDQPHLLALAPLPAPGTDAAPRDLTPRPGRALDEQAMVLLPDGSAVVTGWLVQREEPGFLRSTLVAIDLASGDRRVLADTPDVSYGDPDVSPDGRRVVCVREQEGSYDDPPRLSLWVADLATGDGQELLAGLGMWPTSPRFSADGSAVFFTSDDHGHHPVFRLELSSGGVTRLTGTGHVTALSVAPDGRTLFALRDHIDTPPAPVRIDLTAGSDEAASSDPAGGVATVTPLPAPGAVVTPGRVESVDTVVADGTVVHSHLVLPTEASREHPAPLLLWIHGGPLSSWNSWSWRWNPWLMAAHGYAVLLPDPALSTGYGEAMLRRGWGQWGGAPYDDLIAVTDAVEAREDIDASRTAAMGGSYGGYLANWVAGHTDRFRCLVTHASLWSMEQFHATTDVPASWAREWGLPTTRPERYQQWSPHLHADAITTPMLVVHGDKDYRVPVGEGLRLWWDLQRLGVTSQFLYYPDEGHWVLKPGNARVWYETVWSWLATHVLDEPWQRPALL